MKIRHIPLMAAALFLVLGTISGCSDDDEDPVVYTITVSGNIADASWITGDFIFGVYPISVDVGPDGYVGVGSVAGSTDSPYTVTVTSVATTAYVFAFNDINGDEEPAFDGDEFAGCSGDFTVGSADVTSVDIVLSGVIPPTSCDGHLSGP